MNPTKILTERFQSILPITFMLVSKAALKQIITVNLFVQLTSSSGNRTRIYSGGGRDAAHVTTACTPFHYHHRQLLYRLCLQKMHELPS